MFLNYENAVYTLFEPLCTFSRARQPTLYARVYIDLVASDTLSLRLSWLC